ncbi:hypothetical protein AAKU67_000924, partial [Oxalobacteraceae bacterium GrIS 2.11]
MSKRMAGDKSEAVVGCTSASGQNLHIAASRSR